ncbi:questin oxidase family protein [Phytomonospora sp. NPDC050363]|uniref:questin oxidase family protein n=1 Tax=Phytomonospora sp. NPDC050363 TaxID=3155642 RepID=UPI0033DBD1FE
MSPTPNSQGILDEAYDRLHTSGPERVGGWLTNHAPMTVEALARNGHADAVHHWIDVYAPGLDEVPRGLDPVTDDNWREALGDGKRLGDWPAWFRRHLAEREWTDVLAEWWPRLLPGIAAGATHGVIRVGHAVRTLREDGVNDIRVEELVQALAYWAARWQPVTGVAAPSGRLDPQAALDDVPRIPDQTGGINTRLDQLTGLSGWSAALAALRPADDPDEGHRRLTDVVTAATRRYLDFGHGNPTMLVHGATAPNAVLRVLPSLPRDQWVTSANIGWAASAAVFAVYAPTAPADPDGLPTVPDATDPADIFAAAAAHGDEHVVKFADTALDVFGWTGSPTALAAALRARDLHEPTI